MTKDFKVSISKSEHRCVETFFSEESEIGNRTPDSPRVSSQISREFEPVGVPAS